MEMNRAITVTLTGVETCSLQLQASFKVIQVYFFKSEIKIYESNIFFILNYYFENGVEVASLLAAANCCEW